MTKVLNSQILVGFGRSAMQANATQYDGAVPLDVIANDLFGWNAVPAPVFTSFNGRPQSVPGMVANLRSDTGDVLGLVSDRYAIHQYRTSLLDNVRAIVGGSSELAIGSAGTNRNGAVGWLSLSLPNTRTTAEGVEYLPNLIAYSSHDGTLATEYRRSVLNMVCNNQMGTMLKMDAGQAQGMSKIRVKHTRNSLLRIEDARHALGILAETSDAFADEVRELCQLSVTERDWETILDELAPLAPFGSTARAATLADNKRGALDALWTNDARVSPWRNTAYGVVQAVNTYGHHVQTVRGSHRDDRNLAATLAGDWDTLDNRTHATVRRVLLQRAR